MLLQLTDPHIRAPGVLTYRRIDTAAYLRRAVDKILALTTLPEAVVITGDLTDFGRPEEYAHLAQLLAPLMPAIPVYLVVGNHDERQALREAFPAMPYLAEGGEFVQYAVPLQGMRLLVLDTLVPGKHYGGLCAQRLQWLEQRLAEAPECPTVIAMHHPPFQTLFDTMDRNGLRTGAPELEAIVRRHPQVQRIVCGHLHRSIQVRFAGTIAMTAPSCAHQLHFALRAAQQEAWTLEPPGFLLHAMNDAQELVSHSVSTADFDGPYPFWDAGGQLID